MNSYVANLCIYYNFYHLKLIVHTFYEQKNLLQNSTLCCASSRHIQLVFTVSLDHIRWSPRAVQGHCDVLKMMKLPDDTFFKTYPHG
jgi:hypothetical protein